MTMLAAAVSSAPVTGLTATVVSHSRVDLTWTLNAGADLSGQLVVLRYVSVQLPTGGAKLYWRPVAVLALTATSYSDVTAPHSSSLQYRISYYGMHGTFAAPSALTSPAATATTPAPTAFKLTSGFEKGPDGALIALNDAGPDESALSANRINSGQANPVYAAAQKKQGALAQHAQLNGSAGSAMNGFTVGATGVTGVYARCYFFLPVLPSSGVYSMLVRGGTINVTLAGLALDSTARVRYSTLEVNGAMGVDFVSSVTTGLGSNTYTANTWHRLELFRSPDLLLFRAYAADDTTLIEQAAVELLSSRNEDSTTLEVLFGLNTSTAQTALSIYIDGLEANNTGWPGPLPSAVVASFAAFGIPL